MLILPLCTAFVYKVLFVDFMRIQSGRYPFFIHLLTAFLPWNYFASSIQGSTRCILESRSVINQLAFPKYLLPVSVVCANLLNFLPSLFVLIGFLIAFKVPLSPLLILLPLVIGVQTVMAIGFSLLTSALQVVHRDVEYLTQLLLMIAFFLTPGFYTIEEVINKNHDLFTTLYLCNPLVGIQNMYRIIFIGNYLDTLPAQVNFFNVVLIPLVTAAGVFFAGFAVFNRYKDKFSDYFNI